jgi:hypothetical protein
MTDTMIKPPLYVPGQRVEVRSHGTGRPWDAEGVIDSVREERTQPEESGGWMYDVRISPTGPRPRKFQTNLRPILEEGDIVRVSATPGARFRSATQEDPGDYVNHRFANQEVTVVRHSASVLRDEFGNYQVSMPDGRSQLIAPEHLTLVRKHDAPELEEWERALLEPIREAQPAPEPEVNARRIEPQPAPAEPQAMTDTAFEAAKAAAVAAAIEDLKNDVADRAMAEAKSRGWCSETEAALEDMGINHEQQVGAEVTVKFRVSTELGARVENPARWLKENLLPELRGQYGVTPDEVELLDFQINRVTRTRKGA